MDLIDIAFDEDARWLRVRHERVTVVCNLSAAPQSIPIASGIPQCLAMASDIRIALEGSYVDLPPDSVAILLR
jgi:hypothetical protein